MAATCTVRDFVGTFEKYGTKHVFEYSLDYTVTNYKQHILVLQVLGLVLLPYGIFYHLKFQRLSCSS